MMMGEQIKYTPTYLNFKSTGTQPSKNTSIYKDENKYLVIHER